jgi:hypothetical protein
MYNLSQRLDCAFFVEKIIGFPDICFCLVLPNPNAGFFIVYSLLPRYFLRAAFLTHRRPSFHVWLGHIGMALGVKLAMVDIIAQVLQMRMFHLANTGVINVQRAIAMGSA